jgi:hypothetical protein
MNHESSPARGSDGAFEELRKQHEDAHRDIQAAVARLQAEKLAVEVVAETPEMVTIECVGLDGEVRRFGLMKTSDVGERIEANVRTPHDLDSTASRRASIGHEEG